MIDAPGKFRCATSYVTRWMGAVAETPIGKQIRIEEAVLGDGDTCGGVFLNRRFTNWLKEDCKNHPGWDEDTLEAGGERFEEYLKVKFDGYTDVSFPVPGLESDASKKIKRGKLTMSAAAMKSIFDPIISSICTLLSKQSRASKGVKAVPLVGGFGQNGYLRQCVRKILDDEVLLLLPPNGNTAVVRGALKKALAERMPGRSSIRISTRVARKSYGNICSYSFTTGNPTSQRFWNDFDGRYDITKMACGDQIKESEPVLMSFTTRRLNRSGKLRSYSTTMLAFDGPGGPPMYPDEVIRELKVLKADLSMIPAHGNPIVTGEDEKLYYDLDFQIHITFFSATTKYELWYKDTCYGMVTAEHA